MASHGKSTLSDMPAVTTSQTSASLHPIPPPYQKSVDNAQKKTSSVFQGSKVSTSFFSTNTISDISVLFSQIKSYMEQQDKTNQRILREIDDIKKQKRPVEDHSRLVPKMLDFITPANAAQ
ncbi:hypothetical protein Hanom_Chr08g00721531 [Helianthus anomalus]